jgi:hypothetical protein
MITFIIVPLVAGFFTLLFSKIDIMLRGDRAREPIFQTGFLFDTLNKVDIKVRGDRAIQHPIFKIEPKEEAVHYDFSAAKAESAAEGDDGSVKADGTSEENDEVETAKGGDVELTGGVSATETTSNDDTFVDNEPGMKKVAEVL